MNLGDELALVDEAEVKSIGASSALNNAKEQIAVSREAMTQQVNRLLLLRGDLPSQTLTRAINEVHNAMLQIEELERVIERANAHLTTSINLTIDYRRIILS